MRTSPGRFLTASICLIETEREDLYLICVDHILMITLFDRNAVITFNTNKVLIPN